MTEFAFLLGARVGDARRIVARGLIRAPVVACSDVGGRGVVRASATEGRVCELQTIRRGPQFRKWTPGWLTGVDGYGGWGAAPFIHR